MPVYEFNCKKCGKDFEDLVGSNALSSVKCPVCGFGNVKKKMSVFGCATSIPQGCPAAEACGASSGCGHKRKCGCGH